MSEATAVETMPVQVTDGTIAAINLNSALAQSWGRFWQAPLQPGIAERLVEQELLNAQFLGDLGAYGRLEQMVSHLLRIDSTSARTALVDAQVAASTHRFADARAGLAQAMERGAPAGATDRLAMSIDQACGTELDALLETRLRLAAQSGRLEDWMPLGALLADLREFDEAEQAYCRALDAYSDVSPFAVAWVFFQLGVLWGELVPEPQAERAARWYSKAIAYLPDYVKARVHLAEIRLGQGRHADARTALVPALASGDPQASLASLGCVAGDGTACRGRGPIECRQERLRVFAGQTPACVRGPRRGVLRCQWKRRTQGARAGEDRCRESTHAARLRAGPCSRAGRGRHAGGARTSHCGSPSLGIDARLSVVAAGGCGSRIGVPDADRSQDLRAGLGPRCHGVGLRGVAGDLSLGRRAAARSINRLGDRRPSAARCLRIQDPRMG